MMTLREILQAAETAPTIMRACAELELIGQLEQLSSEMVLSDLDSFHQVLWILFCSHTGGGYFGVDDSNREQFRSFAEWLRRLAKLPGSSRIAGAMTDVASMYDSSARRRQHTIESNDEDCLTMELNRSRRSLEHFATLKFLPIMQNVMWQVDNLTRLPTIGWIRDHWRELECALPKINAVLYFDVDTLYCVKDLFGMEESDNRLVFTADTIRENVPQEFPVVRFAGDEFLSLVDDRKFTEHDLKKLIKLLDDPGYKINVNYSNINHFSVSGCMLKTGEIDSFEKLGSLADRAIEVIRQKKSPTEFRKYELQSVMAIEDAI